MVALGGNLGDRSRNLSGAVRDLRATAGVRVVALSSWMETEPVGGPPDQPLYLNGAAHLETRLSPRELFERLREIERAHGRERPEDHPNAPRTLDLDLLLFGDVHVDEPDLKVPHPRLEERLFVLEPLCEIAPDLVLPRTNCTVRERVAELRGER